MLGEIFSKPGTLLLPSTPQALQSGLAWGEVLTNRILICVAVGIMILSILDIIRFFPHLLFCLRRSYGSENIEHSIAVTRLRNRCAFVAALPFCLMADYFGVYRDTLLCSPGQQWSALIVMALLFVYLLLRKLISLVIRPRNIGGEKYNAFRHCLWNYFILLVLNLLFILAPIRLMGVPWDVSRWIFLSVTGLFYLVALFREAQILSSVCNGLRTILYLCALELVPAAVLVVPAVLL